MLEGGGLESLIFAGLIDYDFAVDEVLHQNGARFRATHNGSRIPLK
jgi:hypothetical protein